MPQIGIIIVRSNFFLIRFRGILNTGSLSIFIGVAESKGQEMICIDRGIDLRIQMPLLMRNVIEGEQHIISRILRIFRQG